MAPKFPPGMSKLGRAAGGERWAIQTEHRWWIYQSLWLTIYPREPPCPHSQDAGYPFPLPRGLVPLAAPLKRPTGSFNLPIGLRQVVVVVVVGKAVSRRGRLLNRNISAWLTKLRETFPLPPQPEPEKPERFI